MLDPLIPLSVKPPQLMNLDDIYAAQRAQGQYLTQQKTAGLQQTGLEQENQQRGIEIQENQAVKDAITKAYQSGGNLETAMPDILKASPIRGQAFQKTLLENKKTLQELSNSAFEHDMKVNSAIAQVMDPAKVTDQASFDAAKAALFAGHVPVDKIPDAYTPQLVQDYHARGTSQADQLAQIKEKREAATAEITRKTAETELAAKQKGVALQELSAVTDQPGYDAWRQRNPDVAKTAPPMYSPAAVAQLQRQAVPVEKQPEFDIAANKAKLGITGNNDFETVFLPAYAQRLGKSIQQLTPEEKMQSFSAYAQAKADPEVRASLLASRSTMEALKQMQLSQMPTPESAKPVAEDIINHRMSPEQMSSLFGGFGPTGQAFKRMVYAEAKKLDPQFNFEQASSDYQYGKSTGFQQTVRYMDSVQNSIPQLQAAAEALGNGNVRSINALVNAGKNQFNNIDLKKFQADRTLVGDEIAKILQGGGTGSGTSDAKLKQAQDLLSSSDSPAAIATTLKEVNQLIGYRRDSLTKGTYMEGRGPAASTPPPAQNTPGQHKEGDIVVNPQTKQRLMLKGNQWVPAP